MTNAKIDLLNEVEVIEELRRLTVAGQWADLIALTSDHACAKQRHELEQAEAQYIQTLSPEQRAKRMAGAPVNVSA